MRPIFAEPTVGPIGPSGVSPSPLKTTLSRAAEAGERELWTAARLPDGATVRIGSETAVVRESFWSQGRGIFAELTEPLSSAYPLATVVTVIARKGECPHLDAVPVDLLVGGERVAWLCVGCGEQLPANYGCRCCWPGNGEGYELVTPLDGSPPYVEPVAKPVTPEKFMRGGGDGQ